MYYNSVNNFLFVIIIDLTFLCLASSQSEDIHVNIDDPLTLPCTVNDYKKASWEGPCKTILSSTRCSTNTTPYFDGLHRKTALPDTISLETYKEQTGYLYKLHIIKVSVENIGSYKCFEGTMVKERNFKVILRVKPSNPVIENMTTDSRMTGTEGVPLDLVCTVTSGIPLETITWKLEQSIVAEGGPGTIQYSFIPTSENNGQQYSCFVNSDALESPLKRTVQLDIKYRPVVQCIEEPMTVIEGNILTVQCAVHSNPPPIVEITRHGVKLKECRQSPCSLKLKSSRNDSGIYWCTAHNEIGNESNCHTMVKIFYPPDVSVIIMNDTTLRCSATGEPNNATFTTWQHYSNLGTVTHYNGSEYLTLCSSCKRYIVNGLYVCGASNGIKHADGNDTSFGNLFVQIKGNPEVLPKTNRIQYGKYENPGTLEVFVYSITLITESRLFRNNTIIENSLGRTINYGFKNVHRIFYHLTLLEDVDFANYTFEVQNDQGAINFTVELVAKVDVTDERKSENNSANGEFSIPFMNIGISVGSSIVGTLVSLFIYRCCKKIRTSSNINITTEPEVQYDEIDEGNLQEMDDIHVPPGTHVQEPSGLTNSQLDAQTEESSDLNDMSQSNVEIENGVSLDIILREASSSSEDSDDVHLPRHSYINVPSFLGNTYESLEASSLEDVDNYYKITTNVPLETNYYNLRV